MKICIVTIATDKYLQFVERLLDNIEKNFLNGHDIHCLLFTDRFLETSDNIKVSQIIHKPWPEPALKKYNYINSEYDYLKNFDYVYLFDADVGIVNTIGDEVLKEIVGVLHPYKILEDKSIYPYEKNIESTAYVSDNKHDKYYAAAFVGGESSAFLNMAKIIAERVECDEKAGIIAKWHDESHLNKYFNENPPSVLEPSYMFPEELIGHPYYPFEPKIVALKKNSSFNQEKIEMGQYPL